MTKPQVTVLMPVYNGAKYLQEAIDSILGQTFTDFELLVINDGSVDGSVRIVESYQDQRIRLVNAERNMGIVSAMNTGLKLACGTYIARLDQDDISLPTRLEKQFLFLENNPQVALVGSWGLEVNPTGTGIHLRFLLTEPAIIHWRLFFCNSFIHSSVMYRKSVASKLEGYSEAFPNAEDYDLWSRISFAHDLANVPEVLVKWRNWEGNISTLRAEEQGRQAALISARNIKRIWPEASARQLRALRTLYQRNRAASKEEIEELITAVDIFQERYSRKFDIGKDIKNLKVEITTHLFSAILYSGIKPIDRIRLLFKLTAKMKPNIFRIVGIFFFQENRYRKWSVSIHKILMQ